MRRIFIFLGPPGAGKGTQAKMFCEDRNIPHISTGDMLRASMSKGTTIGNKVKEIVDSGQLVSDDLMIDLIRERISQEDTKLGLVLDGFPRTIPQAEALDVLLNESSEKLESVVLFAISKDILMSRLETRREKENRADDNLEVQVKRINVYEEQTAPLISFYKNKNLIVEINSDGSVEDVKTRIKEKIS